jgi:hypothetical protein
MNATATDRVAAKIDAITASLGDELRALGKEIRAAGEYNRNTMKIVCAVVIGCYSAIAVLFIVLGAML